MIRGELSCSIRKEKCRLCRKKEPRNTQGGREDQKGEERYIRGEKTDLTRSILKKKGLPNIAPREGEKKEKSVRKDGKRLVRVKEKKETGGCTSLKEPSPLWKGT